MKNLIFEGIVIPKAESYKDCMQLVKSDAFRYSGKISVLEIIKLYILQPAFRYNFWLRHASYNGALSLVARFILKRKSNKYGIFIPKETKIGYGFFIGHPCGIVINPTTIIGNNVNISQFTTIGANEGEAARIGDEVYIGPGVSIVENITIGNRATIGAGAVVVKNVLENITVAGVPANEISRKKPGRYIQNIWKYSNII